MADVPDLVIRDKVIRFTSNGLARINDIWAAAGSLKGRRPNDWIRLPTTQRFIAALAQKVTGKSRNWTESEMRSVVYTERGIGSFADVRLALAYAEYLDADLAIEVREVFLRFKVADPTLADELLDRATPDANEWVARRAMGRVVRNHYTTQLSDRGIRDGREYAICTNATYEKVLGAPAKSLKAARNLPVKSSLRDGLDMKELAFVAAAEALAIERMEDENSQGFVQCHAATSSSASVIGGAIAADRISRRKPVARK